MERTTGRHLVELLASASKASGAVACWGGLLGRVGAVAVSAAALVVTVVAAAGAQGGFAVSGHVI